MQRGFALFVLVAVSGLARGDDLSINTLIDLVFDDITESLSNSGESTISLPDISETIKENFFSLGVTATSGVFSDLSTLARSGDASLTLSDDAATINVTATLGTMKVVYGNTTVSIGEESVTDSLTVQIGENAVGIAASLLVVDEACQVTLDSVTIGQLGGVSFTMGSLGEEAIVIEALTNWVLENFNTKIKTLVEDKITSVGQSELSSMDLCAYL